MNSDSLHLTEFVSIQVLYKKKNGEAKYGEAMAPPCRESRCFSLIQFDWSQNEPFVGIN
jgi:hypothetical protein